MTFGIEWRTQRGAPVAVGERTLTPEAQALTVRFPYGGFVWNRPVGVIVEGNGRSQHLPIIDVTRAVLLILGGITSGVMLGIALAILTMRMKEHRLNV